MLGTRIRRNFCRFCLVLLGFTFSFPLLSEEISFGGPPIDEPLELYLSTGNAQSLAATHIHTSLAAKWPRISRFENFDRAGFYQIYFGVLGLSPRFPYFAGVFGSERLRFMNFGRFGFFIGMASQPAPSAANEARSDQDRAKFESLEWGALYLSPSTVNNPSFLRDYFMVTGGAPEIKKSLGEIGVGRLKGPDLRSAFLLVWSGGANCLASQGVSDAAEPHVPPSWMRCDARLGAKISKINDLNDDEQFLFLISGREADLEQSSCKALGVQGQAGIEGFGLIAGPKGRCVLYRSRSEDSKGPRSKVHCLDPVGSHHLWRNLDYVDFAFPTVDPETFFLVESQFSPPRVTEISLKEGFFQSVSDGQAAFAAPRTRTPISSQQLQGLPQGQYGIYQCQATVLGAAEKRMYFVDQDVFKGRRQVSPPEDRVYGYFPTREGGLQSKTFTWAELMEQFPAIDSFPEMSCAFDPDIDVKCGVRVLQTAIQLLWERRAGDLDRVATPELVKATAEIQLHLLTKVRSALPDWGLAKETAFLLAQYELLLHDKGQTDVLMPLRRGSASENDWQRYLSAPEGFWQ